MKNSVYILLLYLFVAQFWIIWYLRNDERFYVIGLANFIFLIIFQIIAHIFKSKNTLEKVEKNEVKEHWKPNFKESIHNFCKNYFFAISIFTLLLSIIWKIIFDYTPWVIFWFLMLFFVTMIIVRKDIVDRKIHLWKKLFLPKDYLFWISIVIWAFIYSNLWAIIIGSRILISSIIWFLFFTICVRSLKLIWWFQFKKLRMTRFYILLLIVWIWVTWFQFYNWVTKNKLISWNQQLINFSYEYVIDWINSLSESIFWSWKIIIPEEKINKQIIDTWDDSNLVFTWQWEVILTSNSESWNILSDTWNNISWNVINSWNLTETGTIDLENSWWNQTWNVLVDTWVNTVWEPVKLIDILKSLFTKYETPLIYTKNIKFTRVSQNHSRFKYFRTAYNYWLIWKASNPEKYLACENYVVMVWIMENREMTWWKTMTDYWNKAIELNKLNGCQTWQNVTTNNL